MLLLLLLLLPELLRLEGSHPAVAAALLCRVSRLTAAPRGVLHCRVLVARVLPAGLRVACMHGGVLLLLLRPCTSRVRILVPGLLSAVLVLLVPRRIVLLLVRRLLPGKLIVSWNLRLVLRVHLLGRPRCRGRRIGPALLLERWRRLCLQDDHIRLSIERPRPAPSATMRWRKIETPPLHGSCMSPQPL